MYFVSAVFAHILLFCFAKKNLPMTENKSVTGIIREICINLWQEGLAPLVLFFCIYQRELFYPIISYHILMAKVNRYDTKKSKNESSEIMVKVTKEQAQFVMAHINEIDGEARSNPITRTMKQKSKRHNYYACDDPSVRTLINLYNSQINVIETYGSF